MENSWFTWLDAILLASSGFASSSVSSVGRCPLAHDPVLKTLTGFLANSRLKKSTKKFVKLKGIFLKFYEFLRQIQDSRLNRSRVFHFTILSLHKDHWPLPPEIAKFYFTSLAKKRLMIYSINRFPHVRFRYFFSFLLNQ